MKQKWKQKLPGILLGLVFLVGLGIFAYPTVADQWNKYHQSRAIASYEEMLAILQQRRKARNRTNVLISW